MSPFPNLVESEVQRTKLIHKPLASHDEAMSVLDEEVHEIQAEVYKKQALRKSEDLLSELVQTASLAQKWAEHCGLDIVIRNKFRDVVAMSLVVNRRSLPPANSDHENLTRVKRIMARLWGLVAQYGPGLGPCQEDVAMLLVTLGAMCQRWAEDRGLVPLASAPEMQPTRVTVVASAAPESAVGETAPASENLGPPSPPPQPATGDTTGATHATAEDAAGRTQET
jgi:hypothetical protein